MQAERARQVEGIHVHMDEGVDDSEANERDRDAAVEAGVPGIYVHPLNGERVRVSDGDVAFFSPRTDSATVLPA